jgi:hypothetical protein
VLQTGIGFFCVVFAVNSAVHSYLVLRYAEGNKAAVTVGFYYCSNAAGRVFGTLLSGVLYTYAGSAVDGFGWCASSTLRSRGCACNTGFVFRIFGWLRCQWRRLEYISARSNEAR